MSTTRAAGITAAAGTRLTRPLLLVLFRHENSVHKVHALGVPPSWFPTLRSSPDCCAPSGPESCLSVPLRPTAPIPRTRPSLRCSSAPLQADWLAAVPNATDFY